MPTDVRKNKDLDPQSVKGIPLAATPRDLQPFREQKDQLVLSPLSVLRRRKGLSQKQLAEKIGMERTRLVRLEKRPWDDISLGDLENISGALGFKVHEMLARYSGFGKENLCNRTQLGVPHFKIDTGKGYRFGSVLEKPKECFIGTLQIDPQKGLLPEDTPKAEFLYYLVLEGDLLVTMAGHEYRMRQTESFTLDSARAYEFYNPHQFNETRLLIFALPSFIQSV